MQVYKKEITQHLRTKQLLTHLKEQQGAQLDSKIVIYQKILIKMKGMS